MKVILLQDVKNLGKKGDVVTVSDGYGSNFLIKNRLAVLKTEKSTEVLNQQIAADKKKYEEDKKAAEEVKEKLKNIECVFVVKSSPNGKMLGSVTAKQIESFLKETHDIIIDKRKFLDNAQVNTFGSHILKIELFKGVIAEVKVTTKV